MITVDNYYIDEEISKIVSDLKLSLTNGKLAFHAMTNAGYSVPCPVHKNGLERKNSCYIDPETGVFHCFSCGASGNLAQFVKACFECSDEFAKDWLIRRYGKIATAKINLGEPIKLGKKNTGIKIDGSALETYTSYCPYLAQRKLNRTICEEFNVKYDPKERKVVFPVYNTKGELVLFAKRAIDYKSFFMPKDARREVYNLNIIIKNNLKRAMIAEGPIDCLTGWCHNVPTIATLGSIADEQIADINNSGINILYVAFDNDYYGEQFRARLKKKLGKHIILVDVYMPTGKKDVNDLSDSEWEQLIKQYNLPQIENNLIKFVNDNV